MGRLLVAAAPPALAAAVVVVLWYAAIEVFRIPPFFLPAPHSIAEALATDWFDLVSHAVTTTIEAVAGLALSTVVGALIAILMSEIPFLSRAILPWLVMSQAIPKVAVAPLFVIWLGFGLGSTIMIAFFISFFPVVISTAAGLMSVLPEERDLFRTITRNRWTVYRDLKIPRALPQFFDGVKVATSLALIGAVVGEFVSGRHGLGYLVLVANRNLQISLMFADFVVLSIIGILLFYAVVAIEALVLPWHRAQSAGARSVRE